ncbi:protein TIC 22, chloroplastic-like isoform X1 [Durio zibethinus]|uniref:Protein TIC 22, chloroplastic n=1 Tax=Durio zibethinus TaxID=66656 RepID=A0A6P6B5J9_DURZI|nr:protein TIC 22, chloroplastic-like isoform X1 [Durio zibethinus]
MEFPKPPPFPSNPLLSLSSFIHRLGAELANRLHHTNHLAATFALGFSPPVTFRHRPLFASVSEPKAAAATAAAATLSPEQVAKTLCGTAVYTVSNSNNEFVLISDPNGAKSIGLLCFRQEDAETFLAQVRLRRSELRSNAKVVPITLDQVYSLKVEGIAFRFLPDPVQIKNALELKASAIKSAFDGVPVFQSDLLVVRKKNKRFCPIYFNKEDIEKELSKVSRASKGPGVSQHIMVGSLEDVLKKMEMSEKSSGWEDLIFIPPGKSCSQHIQDVVKI